MSILTIPTFKQLKEMPSVDHVFFEIFRLLEFDITTRLVTRSFKKKVYEVEILEKVNGIYVKTFLMNNNYIIGLTYEDYVGGLYDLYDYVELPTGIHLKDDILIDFKKDLEDMIISEKDREDYYNSNVNDDE